MMKEISKNDLHKVVLVGKGPELQTLFSIIGYMVILLRQFKKDYKNLKDL